MSVSGGGKGGSSSVYDKSAGAYDSALGMTGEAAAMMRDGNPALQGEAALVNAPQVTGPATIASGMSTYMNPYTQDVIDATMGDIQRQTNMQQDVNAAGASRAGAFGGARHGLVEAETNASAQRTMAQTAAQLREGGFTTAAQLAGQDIGNLMQSDQFNAGMNMQGGLANQNAQNQWTQMQGQDWLARATGLGGLGSQAGSLAQTGFNFGQQIDQQQMVQGSMQQQLIQSIMDKASGQYTDYTSQPNDILSMALQSLGMNPMNKENTTTSQYTPGLFDYMSLGAQVMGA